MRHAHARLFTWRLCGTSSTGCCRSACGSGRSPASRSASSTPPDYMSRSGSSPTAFAASWLWRSICSANSSKPTYGIPQDPVYRIHPQPLHRPVRTARRSVRPPAARSSRGHPDRTRRRRPDRGVAPYTARRGMIPVGRLLLLPATESILTGRRHKALSLPPRSKNIEY